VSARLIKADAVAMRPRVDGKFLSVDGRRFLVKGVAYGTFAPDSEGAQFPSARQVERDFALMAEAGINTVRTYTVPREWILDEAARHGLHLMIGMPWAQHVAFLDDPGLARQVRLDAVATVTRLGRHPAALLFALGNEIPPSIVRWHGQRRVERFLSDLASDVKAASPSSLITYVNFPPTEYLDLDPFDVCAFNVYLHRKADLRAYLGKLQHIAGNKPLLLAEAGADSIREGEDGQARITEMHIRAAFAEGACGTVAFSWTDEWWRGGHRVTDWKFGLVDAQRRPKPALAAVTRAFAETPFSRDEQQQWPKVSVVVCAYNAADTIDDCLSSLAGLNYPSYEVIVVNDGSRDDTSARAKQYSGVRVIDIANGGLSAARNLGLAEATGDVVAYTDADVRVDPDWLAHLVQPLLERRFVGSGGPNIVPADDPWKAQCVARAPGGPTQVLLDDRVAEHVPGCNMAFRRDALLAVGGFNPVYLRAGDDVDVCWRLQAKGHKIGFAPSALVWHHHRATVRAFWRQQAGYGEGETWLDAHHPEKFIDGQMLWRGRIYSPLPFVRSFTKQRLNTGVWGTAAFPSVYRTDVNPWQFLPHSTAWMVASTLAVVAGLAALLTPYPVEALLLMVVGAAGWLTTVARCATYARRTDLTGMPGADRFWTRVKYRALILWLHLLQPVARAYGRLRGKWSPPEVVAAEHTTRMPWKAPVPTLRDAARSALVVAGASLEREFWSERWTSNDATLTELAGELRAARPAGLVEVDDGWRADHDLRVAVSRWGHLRVRALIEEHAEGRCLLRVGLSLHPTFLGVMGTLGFAILMLGATSAALALRWPSVALVSSVVLAGIFARAAWQTTRVAAVVDRALGRATSSLGFVPIESRARGRRAAVRIQPATSAQLVQTALLTVVITSAVLSGFSVAQDLMEQRRLAEAAEAAPASPEKADLGGGVAVTTAGDLFVADSQNGLISRLRARVPYNVLTASQVPGRGTRSQPTTMVAFDRPSDIALAPNGDLLVADAEHHRVCRVDGTTGRIVTIAGYGYAGFDGDDLQATQTALNSPAAVTVARNGDLYIADTANHRVRMVAQATGLIRTVAGDGEPGTGGQIGDGGPAVLAHLDSPSGVAVAPNGDVYISDTGHHRIRRVDAATGIISTIAGDGTAGSTGDEGPGIGARLAAPMGLAVARIGQSVAIYVADSLNGRIRVIRPDLTIATVGGTKRFTTPTRVAYHPAGWLYVKDASHASVTMIPAPRLREDLAAARVRRPQKVT
jgi:GT2 family glycosyltransferase